MFYKGALLKDKVEKIRVFDELIAKYLESSDSVWREHAVLAMIEKARLIDDRNEQIKLYDTVLLDMEDTLDPYQLFVVFPERFALATDADEKLRLIDRFIAANGDHVDLDFYMSLLLDKAVLVTDPAEKSRLYGKIIEHYQKHPLSKDIPGTPCGHQEAKEHQRDMVLTYFGEAVLDKADMVESAGEKLDMYNMYLALLQLYNYSYSFFVNEVLTDILTRKAIISGDPSVKNVYYDDKIRNAATESDRAIWYYHKSEAVEMREKARVKDELINVFIDSTDPNVKLTVVSTLHEKALQTRDAREKIKWCDQIFAHYGDSTDGYILSIVIDALAMKADMTEDNAAKFKIYDDMIERYQSIDDPFVKYALERIRTAKSALETGETVLFNKTPPHEYGRDL
jgi:hypothetical protein